MYGDGGRCGVMQPSLGNVQVASSQKLGRGKEGFSCGVFGGYGPTDTLAF